MRGGKGEVVGGGRYIECQVSHIGVCSRAGKVLESQWDLKVVLLWKSEMY